MQAHRSSAFRESKSADGALLPKLSSTDGLYDHGDYAKDPLLKVVANHLQDHQVGLTMQIRKKKYHHTSILEGG